MLPGLDVVVVCPRCGRLARFGTWLSGNTCGARIWTDGKMVAPMAPDRPRVAKCRGCGECYWLEDAEVGEISRWGNTDEGVDPAWEAAEGVEEPSEKDYLAAVEAGLAKDSRHERTLRVLAWRRGNDRFRDATPPRTARASATSAARRKNLEALLGLLDAKGGEDRVMRAEILRELGRFAESMKVLATIESDDLEPYVKRIRSLCKGRDARVRELESHGRGR